MQFLDNGILPQIIHFEHNFLTGAQRTEVALRFSALGYAFLAIGIDTLAYLQKSNQSFENRVKGAKY
jgi:hypothetical protein